MKKFKINSNLLALLVVISLFSGWEYMIIVTAFIWCFCECSQNLKNLTIRAIAIYGGCYLFATLWNLIDGGFGLGVDGLTKFFTILGSYSNSVQMPIELTKYLITPLSAIMDFLGSVVAFIILLVKFRFVVSIITNKPMTGVFSKIQEYINYFVNFANSNLYEDNPQPVQQPTPPVPDQAQMQ